MDLGKKMASSSQNHTADDLQIGVESVSNQYWVLLVHVTAGKLRVFCLQIVGDLHYVTLLLGDFVNCW